MSAKNASSFAFCMPTIRGSSQLPPKSSESPRRVKISEKRARSAATTRSHPSARFMPAPTASPFTFAMVGFGSSYSARAAAFTSPIACSGGSDGPSAARSAPAQKAFPAPVITRTRSVGQCDTSSRSRRKSSHPSCGTAFLRCGRSSVMVATPDALRSRRIPFMGSPFCHGASGIDCSSTPIRCESMPLSLRPQP